MESRDQVNVKVDQIHDCLICCGQISDSQILNDPANVSNAADKKEFCERFVTQALKCFNLNLIVDLSWNSNNGASSSSSSSPTVCPNCFLVADNFCRIYDQWLDIQNEMERSKKKIAELMKTAINLETDGSFNDSGGLKEFREGVVTNVERKTISGQFLREYFGQAPMIHENDIEVKLEATDMEMNSLPGHSQSQGYDDLDLDFFSENANAPPVTRSSTAKNSKRIKPQKRVINPPASANKPRALRGWRYRGMRRPTAIISGDPNSLNGSGFRKPNANTPFSCSLCGPAFYFFSWSTCFKHIKENHGKQEDAYVCYHPPPPSALKPFRCQICDSAFKNKSLLKSHEVVHSDEKPFMCVICGWTCRREYTCKTHVQTRHGTTWQGNVMNIKDGELKFDRRLSLSMADEENQNQITAETGNHFLLSKESESENNQNSTSTRRGPFFCRVCLKAFDTEDLRNVHLENVHGWDPIKIQKENLLLAKKSEKRFFCNVCGKTFSSKTTWSVHEKNHHAVKSIQCGICGWLWTTVQMCKRHLKTVHRKNNLAAEPFVIRLENLVEENGEIEKLENATVVYDTRNEAENHEEETESLLLESKVKVEVEVEIDEGAEVEESEIFMVKTEPCETEIGGVENQMLEITETENLILPD